MSNVQNLLQDKQMDSLYHSACLMALVVQLNHSRF